MKLAVIIGCILAAANFFIFIFMLHAVRFNALGPDGVSIDSYDAISTQITILGVILGAVALGLAAAAFFGYQALEAVVLRRADELVSERFANLNQFQPPEGSTPPPGPIPPAQAVEEQEI